MSDTLQGQTEQPTVQDKMGTLVDQTQVTDTPKVETKPEPEAKPESKVEDKKAPTLLNKEGKAAGPPEKYEPYKLPEGFAIDAKATEAANAVFKELGLSQDSAQKLVDFHSTQMRDAMSAPVKHYQDMQEKWVTEVKADPEIGGAKLEGVKTTISRAIDGLGDPKVATEFRAAMDLTGAGNNPAFIRAFYKLAQQVTEGTHVAGRGPAQTGQRAPGQERTSAAASLYPNLP